MLSEQPRQKQDISLPKTKLVEAIELMPQLLLAKQRNISDDTFMRCYSG